MGDTKAVQNKSRQFAVQIVTLYQNLCDAHHAYDLFRQILRCGTSIGANIAEAEYAISKKDFLSKMYISLKECAETAYWLDLLHDTDYLTDERHQSLAADCRELRKLLSSITKTTSESLGA
ncbi:MAG: four helix bundle protein [Bacillota bacterium]